MSGTRFLQGLPTHELRLQNGLTVIVREDHSAPVVAVVTHVRAGYFDEPDHLVGISHVLEHMYFKGTERRGVGEIARETKSAGGYLNAGTIYDRTSYYTVLPAASLDQALDIQSDALQRSAIAEAELQRELLVIIQEARRKLDNPGAFAREKLFEAMFDTHRIRRWRIGDEERLRSFTRADVVAYYRNLYRASNTIVVMAGDVDPERAFRLAEQYYGAMAAGEPVRDAGDTEPEQRGFRYRELAGDIAQSHLEWGWRTPGTLDADTPQLDVLAVALGQGRASRLYRNVRDAGAVAIISADNYTPTSIGVFTIGAELDPPDTAQASARTADVLNDIRERGFTGAEIERARNVLEARVLRRLETAEGQAHLIAEWQALGDWRRADDYLDALLHATADAVHDVARRHLDPRALTVLLYRPRAAGVFAREPDRLYETLFGARAARSAAPGRAHDIATTADAPRPLAPAARLAAQRVEDGVHLYVLPEHGARIVIKPRRTAPLVSLALFCRGGVLAEGNGTTGLTGLMARTSVKGTRTRPGARLAEETEALGGSIAAHVGPDLVEWSLSIPSRHLTAGVDLLLDAALEPAFEAEAAERERKMALSGLEQLRDDMQQYPVRLALTAAFPDHPYGFGVEQLEHAVRQADLGRLGWWHQERVLRGAPYIIAVGDVADPDAAAGLIAQLATARLQAPGPLHATAAQWGEGGSERVVEREREQTAIALVFPGPPRNHPDAHALQLLASAIAGLGGRLFEELRSRRSLAYTVSAAPVPRWLGGVFLGYIGTAPEREAEARAEMVRQLQRIGEEPLETDELERARRYLLGAWQIRQQTHARQLHDLAHALLLGEGLEELRSYEHRIRMITAEQVRAAAARWLRAEHMVTGIVRGSARGAGA